MSIFDSSELEVVRNMVNDLLLFTCRGNIALNSFLRVCKQTENSGNYKEIFIDGIKVKISDDNLNGGLFIDTKEFNCIYNRRNKDLTLFTPAGHFAHNANTFGYMNEIETCYLQKVNYNDLKDLFFNYVHGELVYLYYSGN